ncbi:terminase small subunit [Rhizobium leguminosarum]|uniref:terminase small subunit n=1 Tax=Rhizobium leguminosarum TaxID=384 RepID=UPI001FEE4414|nr:terminase small subunit [Rhizobium leguminosarum]
MPALSKKQKRFVAEYLIDLKATQAAIGAGYSPKTATVQASRFPRGGRKVFQTGILPRRLAC